MKGDGLRALAGFAAASDTRRLPSEVVEKAKACLLYGMAVGIACMRVKQPAQAAQAVGDAGSAMPLAFSTMLKVALRLPHSPTARSFTHECKTMHIPQGTSA